MPVVLFSLQLLFLGLQPAIYTHKKKEKLRRRRRMKKEQEMGRKKRKNWRRFCGCCDVFFMPEKQLSVVSMSPSPAESCCPIVILVGGHICPCPDQPYPAPPSMSAVVFGSLLFCVVVVPCALFVCLSSMSTSPRLFLQFSFFLLHSVLCPVSCVLSRVLCSNLIAVGTAHMSQTRPHSDTDLES